MKIPMNVFNNLIETLLRANAVKTTKYLSEGLVIKATRKLYNKKIYKSGNTEIILTIGKPNFDERKFIKQCLKAKEPFPIKKIQIKYLKGK